ncbi:hypothetical protein [Aliiruegeria lutimaris]|uniref:Uncharacterized protein n=1 Tax=Aliiruegeria lutimaris TaxID=571298 RepID=A0A1G8VV71_9RHOB|nr:hypothetical protein [Aliiruegeria lutimaris]SDJ70031.1 hypothetical protein SAMN04488026_102252 [Aliiruegeria lutimaris]
MPKLSVSNARLREGVWKGLLVASQERTAPPQIEVIHLATPLDGVELEADREMANVWTLSVPIPSRLISDGVQTFLVREASQGETLARFSIAAGEPLREDVLAELDLLRAELDLLKRAFRRHCVEVAEG